jgi:hypothetical protein
MRNTNTDMAIKKPFVLCATQSTNMIFKMPCALRATHTCLRNKSYLDLYHNVS